MNPKVMYRGTFTSILNEMQMMGKKKGKGPGWLLSEATYGACQRASFCSVVARGTRRHLPALCIGGTTLVSGTRALTHPAHASYLFSLNAVPHASLPQSTRGVGCPVRGLRRHPTFRPPTSTRRLRHAQACSLG
jgi:hypothetical protein